jgi:hypothetical protein
MNLTGAMDAFPKIVSQYKNVGGEAFIEPQQREDPGFIVY